MSLDITLNPAQRTAVEHPPGPVLVVAGAGSGKTRVLTARVAWLLERGEAAESILAFTFTNRAAREMRERIERTVGEAARRLWVGTFHATGVRILRREARVLGIAPDFAIYDREDQEEVLSEILKRLGLSDGDYRTGAALSWISDAKSALVSPEEAAATAAGPRVRTLADAYALYQQELRRNGALDFDDLIGGTVRLLRDHPEVGLRYATRFRHVLVDEYQDTNHAQFLLVRALSALHRSLFAVGDDDQSIYGWRGARPANVLEFEDAFPGASVVRLEQNYRSTGNILEAANAVIARNRARKGKNLWCDREAGLRLRFVLAADDVDEARCVRRFLGERVRQGGSYADCAVLYRTNAQSRAIETDLRKNLIPYEIVGGVPFYQRREVKDLLAYLRLAVNPADAVAFWRVWNTPRRGLGAGVRARVEERMARDALGPLEALGSIASGDDLARSARAGALSFLEVMDELRRRRDEPPHVLLDLLLERTEYVQHLGEDDDAAERRANIDELRAAAAHFAQSRPGALADFLGEAALVSDVDLMSEGVDRVLLLTAHNAKGLEFPVVIVAGLEEGLFPHASSLEDETELEEERRLFYVALTRARDQVMLTAAAYRRRPDGARGGRVSRFVGEVPPELLESEESAARGISAREARADRAGRGGAEAGHGPPSPHRLRGREVYHESFGRGVVVEAEGEGEETKVLVRFSFGEKRVMGSFLREGRRGD